MSRIFLSVFFFPLIVCGQSFAPAPGLSGSTAISKDSSVIINWASQVTVLRGPMNVQNLGAGLASYGVESDGTGMADVAPVSLGDGGEAIVRFPFPITNELGPDFAVFENGFVDHYMEFAFVEVSSDGINYFRFNAISETPTDIQLTNFSLSNCAYVNNLAGKYRQEYGTPFDLEELAGISGLNIDSITYIKLIDVVGSIDPQYGSTDSQGNIINDPFPTEFESGGFDLDAVGVIHELATSGLEEKHLGIHVFPNPFHETVSCIVPNKAHVSLQNLQGKQLCSYTNSTNFTVDLRSEPNGIYFLIVESENTKEVIKLIKH